MKCTQRRAQEKRKHCGSWCDADDRNNGGHVTLMNQKPQRIVDTNRVKQRYKDSVSQLCHDEIPQNSKALFLKSCLRNLNEGLCFGNLMTHHNSLELFTFFTQAEKTAHMQSFMGILQIASFTGKFHLVDIFPMFCAHVPNDMILHVFTFITGWLKSNRWFRRWCQSYPGSLRAVGAACKIFTYAVCHI